MMTPAPQPNATPNMYNSNPGKTGRNYFHSSKSSPQCSSKAEDKKKTACHSECNFNLSSLDLEQDCIF